MLLNLFITFILLFRLSSIFKVKLIWTVFYKERLVLNKFGSLQLSKKGAPIKLRGLKYFVVKRKLN